MNQTIARFAAARMPVEFVYHYLNGTLGAHRTQFSEHVWRRGERAFRTSESYEHFVTWEDDLFPKRLLDIPNPPYCLFYHGDLEVLQERTTAMVGSRELNRISQSLVNHYHSLIEETVSVSGGAFGIDGLVHAHALSTHRPTVAVLGAGLDRLYPAVNRAMLLQIPQEGVLLSEYVPNTPIQKFQFLERNRLVSGLGDALVVIQAKRKSGTMNTVGHALEQGKTVFAVPGSPLDPLAEGPNRLIEEGAIPLTNSDQIIRDLKIVR